MICGQLQRKYAGKVLFPVGKLRVQSLCLQPLLLPVDEVHVLYRERGESQWLSSRKSVIELDQFPPQNPVRPVGRDDMMHHEEQHVLDVGEPNKAGTY